MPSIHDYGLVRATHLGHSTEASQPAADHLTATAQRRLTPIGNGGKGEGLHRCQFHVQRSLWVTRGTQRDRCDDWNLVFRTTTRPATIAFSPEVGIINLNLPTQRLGFLVLAHGLYSLAVNQPCCSVVHTKLPHECQRGNPSLGLAD